MAALVARGTTNLAWMAVLAPLILLTCKRLNLTGSMSSFVPSAIGRRSGGAMTVPQHHRFNVAFGSTDRPPRWISKCR